jgi:heme/copper-type cytochrome/quinol oxidase subunit 2
MSPVSEFPSSIAPYPGRADRPAKLRLLLILFGAPSAWLIQLTVSEPLAAYACYPYQAPLSAPIWEGLSFLLVAISLICLGVALLSGFIAWKSWRRLAPSTRENGEDAAEIISGRSRFLMKLGVMSSFIFIVAVVFNACAVWLVPLCNSGG